MQNELSHSTTQAQNLKPCYQKEKDKSKITTVVMTISCGSRMIDDFFLLFWILCKLTLL